MVHAPDRVQALLIYGRMDPDDVTDHTPRDATEKAIGGSEVDHAVCLALDPVYDVQGQRREDLSHMWVDNDYVLDLRQTVGDKVLWDNLVNNLRGSDKCHRPDTQKLEENLRADLGKGAVIISAHCGLPHYVSTRLGLLLERSEFKTVSRYLEEFPADAPKGGRCYADVSACVTPFRRDYFEAIANLPPQSLLFGAAALLPRPPHVHQL